MGTGPLCGTASRSSGCRPRSASLACGSWPALGFLGLGCSGCSLRFCALLGSMWELHSVKC